MADLHYCDEVGTSDPQLQPEYDDTDRLQVDETATWPEFLEAIEQYCSKRGWSIEYGSVNDESCAIFYQAYPEGQPDSLGHRRGDTL